MLNIYSYSILFAIFLVILGNVGGQPETDGGGECAANPLQISAQDQRAFISLSVKAGVSRDEVHRRLKKACGKNVYKPRQINRLYTEFSTCARTSTERCPVPGRPRTATDEDHEDMLIELMGISRTWTSDDLADQMGISQRSVLRMLHKLEFRKIGPKWLPKMLSCMQKQNRVAICKRNIALYNQDPERFIERVITMDETWMRCYNPLDPQQAREWRQRGEEPPINTRAELRDWKVLMTAAIHNDTVAGWEFLETGQTMNGERFLAYLQNVVAPIIRRKRIRRPLILMDNARPHFTEQVKAYIARMGWQILEHPAWSPDLSPCDYDLFNRVKRPLRGRRFEDREQLIVETEDVLNTLNRESRLVGMANLVNRWKEVVKRNGEYLDN